MFLATFSFYTHRVKKNDGFANIFIFFYTFLITLEKVEEKDKAKLGQIFRLITFLTTRF